MLLIQKLVNNAKGKKSPFEATWMDLENNISFKSQRKTNMVSLILGI